MARLKIRLFGLVRISSGPNYDETDLPRSVQPLFAYLLIHANRFHSRGVLAERFWEAQDREHALRCLSTALWRLRKSLQKVSNGTCDALLTPNNAGDIGINRNYPYWLDVRAFERKTSQYLSVAAENYSLNLAHKLERTLELYRGDALEAIYDDWALAERERLRSLYLDGLALLARVYEAKREWVRSVHHGQRLVAIDPLREDVHRILMRVYMASGQRALAIRQYKICQGCLGEELDAAPMEETQRLYEEVVATAGRKRSPSPAAQGEVIIDRAISRLRSAKEQLESTQSRICDVLNLLERASTLNQHRR